MDNVALRKVLLEERMNGRRPLVVVLGDKDFRELLEDLTIKYDIFDTIFVQGVHVVTENQILRPINMNAEPWINDNDTHPGHSSDAAV